jgi:LmbE family N-acetylglucosaminyl deacetylase
LTKRILVVAPHPDDETLGAGGAIAKYAGEGHDVTILTVAGHRPPIYTEAHYQQTVDEARQAHGRLGARESIFLGLPAVLLGQTPTHELNSKIYAVFEAVRPQIVLCPFPDRHIDHRLIFDSTLVAARPVKVGTTIEILAAYETLSETHWNAPHIEPAFTPNWVVDISEHMETKLDALASYASQIPPFPGPRSLDAIKALAMFRGTQAGFAYGEGFHVIRMIS